MRKPYANEHEPTAQRTHRKERIETGASLTDIYPIFYEGRTAIFQGPVTTEFLADDVPLIAQRAQTYTESDARFNVVRLGRAAQCEHPTGFEGWFLDEEDPATSMVQAIGPHIARAFNPDHSGQDWKKGVRSKERSIRKFIDLLKEDGMLTSKDLQLGDQLMSILVAKGRAHASMSPHRKDLEQFHAVTDRYVQAGRKPKIELDQEEKPETIQFHWNRSPRADVTPDLYVPSEHLRNEEEIVIDFLTELGRFGNPLVRRITQQRNSVQPFSVR